MCVVQAARLEELSAIRAADKASAVEAAKRLEAQLEAQTTRAAGDFGLSSTQTVTASATLSEASWSLSNIAVVTQVHVIMPRNLKGLRTVLPDDCSSMRQNTSVAAWFQARLCARVAGQHAALCSLQRPRRRSRRRRKRSSRRSARAVAWRGSATVCKPSSLSATRHKYRYAQEHICMNRCRRVLSAHRVACSAAGDTSSAQPAMQQVKAINERAEGIAARSCHTSRGLRSAITSLRITYMQVSNGDATHNEGSAHSAAADTAAAEQPADDLREQLAAAQARLVQAAGEAADLRNRLTALSDAEATRDAAQSQASCCIMCCGCKTRSHARSAKPFEAAECVSRLRCPRGLA